MPVRESWDHLAFRKSMPEAACAGGAMVLTLVGLYGVAPTLMVSIATILLGAVLLIEEGLVTSGYSRLISEVGEGEFWPIGVLHQQGIRSIGGIAGIVLGILAVLRVDPNVLVSSAAVVLGTILVLSTGIATRMSLVHLDGFGPFSPSTREVRSNLTVAAGVQLAAGATAIALGVVALFGISTVLLDLVALLTLGTAIIVARSAVTLRIVRLFFGG